MAQTVQCLLALLVLTSCLSEAYKILVVFPMPGRSHGILGDGVVKLLLKAGHEVSVSSEQVTYITPFPKNEKVPNLREIDVSQIFDVVGNSDFLSIKAVMNRPINLNNQLYMLYFMSSLSQATMENENVIALINDDKAQFDLVINEWMFADVYAGFAALFNCPHIWFSSMEPHWLILDLIDESPNPAYTPDIISSNIPPFTFGQRIAELTSQLLGSAMKLVYANRVENALFEKLIAPVMRNRGKPVPDFYEVKYNASMVLANAHVSLGGSIRLPQGFKSVGGYHIDRNVKPLPEDLKKIMDNAKYGVIYFSMGSNLKSKDMPDELKADFLKMFGGLKQTVLWKFEEVLQDLPKNVHILKWAPQPSILAHPNCVLFISHGGYLSTTEAVHFAVPTIGIPVFGDQFNNVDRAVKKGYSIRVDLSYTMTGDVKKAIDEILGNPKYSMKVKELSTVYHDRPILPAAELVHWVEHVVRTGGAPHLRSPALMVPWYQKMYLDLVAVVLVILFILGKLLCRWCCSKNKVEKPNDSKKKKKN